MGGWFHPALDGRVSSASLEELDSAHDPQSANTTVAHGVGATLAAGEVKTRHEDHFALQKQNRLVTETVYHTCFFFKIASI